MIYALNMRSFVIVVISLHGRSSTIIEATRTPPLRYPLFGSLALVFYLVETAQPLVYRYYHRLSNRTTATPERIIGGLMPGMSKRFFMFKCMTLFPFLYPQHSFSDH